MRLDVFLKTSRLIPSRNLAQEFCEGGRIIVNGIAAKPSKEVKTGDSIEIRRRSCHTRVMVVKLPETKQIAKSAAGELYDVVEERLVSDDPVS